ncbi:glycosyltransferase family 4 protein [Acinetobacter indicus]|uniref:glycosyltransferase family 4 protein n=1 Tax=Acinetobacter indicus TaxID=756892 RepID=UPI000CEC30E5|nr:glycosyltransferase family 4 protein [Acinetobacter indicus]
MEKVLMRILYITQFFNPEPSFKGLKFAKDMQKYGHEFEVLTGFPNYPEGKIYTGYKLKPYQHEVLEGIAVHRVWLYPDHSGSVLKRIANYVSFFITALIAGLFLIRKFDAIHVAATPLNVGLVGVILGKIFNKPVLSDIQDIWPDSLAATGMLKNPKTLKFISYFCNWSYRNSKKITVISKGFRDLLVQRGVPENKIEVIYNWSGLEGVVPTGNHQLKYVENTFNVTFAGNMGKAQDLANVISVAKLLSKTHPEIIFNFIGDGVEKQEIMNLVAKEKLKNVIFYDRVTSSEVINYLEQSDCLLISLKKDPLFEITVPSKTQAYLSLGKPVISTVLGNAADLIRKADAGYIVEPADPHQLAEVIIKMSVLSKADLAQKGLNAKEFYIKNLSRQASLSKFSNTFNTMKD